MPTAPCLSNTLTNLCIALYCILLYCVVLNCLVLLIYCYVDIIQYNSMHKFVGVLDNPRRLTAVVSQIRCNNGCANRWKSGYSKFVSLKPLSQQNPFLSLKVQVLSEIILFEMLYRTDHRTLRRPSLGTFRFHEIEPSLCTFLLFRTIIS